MTFQSAGRISEALQLALPPQVEACAARSPAAARDCEGSAGFTLIELLAVLLIVAILTTIAVAAVSSVKSQAATVREISAGRQLVTAYLLAAAENNNELMRGYDKDATVRFEDGSEESGPVAARYPWRLASYLQYKMEGVFILDVNTKLYRDAKAGSANFRYITSLNPALGLNAYCLGGYYDGSGDGPLFEGDVARRLGQVPTAASMILFASARMTSAQLTDPAPGNFLITPPILWRTKWAAKYSEKDSSSSYGNLHLRNSGRVVAACLDGHAELLDETQLRDMRRWSYQAQLEDNPNYVIQR